MTTKFSELQISQIHVHPKNVRTDVGNVVDLANSITAQGILQPLVVAPALADSPWTDTSGISPQYTIIAGHRRHAASHLANLDALPCVIREDLDTEAKQLEAMLVENTQRTDLTLMEEATAYQGLLDLPGYNAKELARKVGRSQKFVKDRAKLTTLPEAAIEKLNAKQMTIEDGLIFAEFTDDAAATEQLLANHGSYNWEWTVRMMRERRENQAVTAKVKAEVESLGATIIERPDNLHYNDCDYVQAARYPDFDGWDDAQHVAAGHHAVVDAATRGSALWLLPKDEAPELPDATARQETPEQAAKRQRIEDLNAGLRIAAHVRHEHLRAQVLKPTPELVYQVLERKIKQLVKSLHSTELPMYLNIAEDSKPAEIRAALEKLDSEQLDTLQLLAGRYHQEQSLLTYSGWGESSYGSDWAKDWRELVTGPFGYELSDIEREAMTFMQEETAAAIAAREAEQLDEDEEDNDE